MPNWYTINHPKTLHTHKSTAFEFVYALTAFHFICLDYIFGPYFYTSDALCNFSYFIGKFAVGSNPSILTVFVNIVLSPPVSLGSLQEESCLQFIFRNSKIAL